MRRIAWIRTSNAFMLVIPPRPPPYASAHMTGSSGPRLTRGAAPGIGGIRKVNAITGRVLRACRAQQASRGQAPATQRDTGIGSHRR
jgi:hypothetical protein